MTFCLLVKLSHCVNKCLFCGLLSAMFLHFCVFWLVISLLKCYMLKGQRFHTEERMKNFYGKCCKDEALNSGLELRKVSYEA